MESLIVDISTGEPRYEGITPRTEPATDEHEPFPHSVLSADLGRVRIVLIEADSDTTVRRQGQKEPTPHGTLHLCQPLRGVVRVTQDSRSGEAGPGEMIAYDPARPYTLHLRQDLRLAVLQLPCSLVGVIPHVTGSLTAAPWSAAQGPGALLSQLVNGLASHLTDLDPLTTAPLGESLAALAAPVIASQLRGAFDNARAERYSTLLRVQAFVRERLSCPELSPAVLARRHNVSLRYLQKVFEEQGFSPAKWIRQERLARCSAELRDPRYMHLSVATIGQRAGIYRPSHLSQLFREHYGITPREYRQELVPEAVAPVLQAAGSF